MATKFEKLSKEATIYHGDCIELMRSWNEGRFSAVFADPPYGNNTEYITYEDSKENLRKLVKEFMPQALRISWGRVFVTCGVANMWMYPEPTWTLAWVNPAGVGSSSWGFTCWQPILAYGKDPYLQDGKGRRPDTLFQRKTDKINSDHPCSKPVNVMRWIIERTTRKGDIVLDPFMGSGITGVACVQMGRRFVGIELEEEYYQISKKNITEALMQPNLL